jgi:hypothetical protein
MSKYKVEIDLLDECNKAIAKNAQELKRLRQLKSLLLVTSHRPATAVELAALEELANG